MTEVDSRLADALRDRYMLEKELGRGGMATVYLAQDLRHARAAAQVRRVAEMTADGLRRLDRARIVVILPGGILEEHGPYLPVYSDRYPSRLYGRRHQRRSRRVRNKGQSSRRQRHSTPTSRTSAPDSADPRPCRIAGDSLILGDDHTWRRVFVRLADE